MLTKMNKLEADRFVSGFLTAQKEKAVDAKIVEYGFTDEDLVIADIDSIFDKSETDCVPAIYYIIPLSNPSTWYKVHIYEEDGDYEECFFMGECDGLISKIVKVFDSQRNAVEITIPDSVCSAIEKLAEAYTVNNIEDAESEMVSPGIPEVRYLSNGDPGYPGEDPEFEILCPHCEKEVSGEPGDVCRCDTCKRFIKIADFAYDEY